MIALMDLNGKINGIPFTVLSGREIPKHVLKTLDVESMKKNKQIKDSKEIVKRDYKK